MIRTAGEEGVSSPVPYGSAWRQMWSTVSLHESAFSKWRLAKTFLKTLRANGVGTPWYGIVDFMYACIPSALLGSATCFSSDRN